MIKGYLSIVDRSGKLGTKGREFKERKEKWQ